MRKNKRPAKFQRSKSTLLTVGVHADRPIRGRRVWRWVLWRSLRFGRERRVAGLGGLGKSSLYGGALVGQGRRLLDRLVRPGLRFPPLHHGGHCGSTPGRNCLGPRARWVQNLVERDQARGWVPAWVARVGRRSFALGIAQGSSISSQIAQIKRASSCAWSS